MRAEAIRLADAGSTLAGDDAFVLAISGHVLTYLGHEYDRGASMVERAVSLNPNLAVAWYSRGWVTLMCGEAERSIESFDRMIRLSPLDRLRTSAWNGSSFALYQLGRYDEGCAIAMKSIQLAKHAHTLAAFAVNASSAGRTTEAMQTVAELLKLHPGFRTSHVREAFPVRDPDQREKMAVALREAGLPD